MYTGNYFYFHFVFQFQIFMDGSPSAMLIITTEIPMQRLLATNIEKH